MNNRPDGMLGAILASESIGTADTLINGAGGCRSRAMILLNVLVDHSSSWVLKCAGCF